MFCRGGIKKTHPEALLRWISLPDCQLQAFLCSKPDTVGSASGGACVSEIHGVSFLECMLTAKPAGFILLLGVCGAGAL